MDPHRRPRGGRGGARLKTRPVLGLLLLLAAAGRAAPSPEELFAGASAAFDAGDPDAASSRLDEFRSRYADHRLFWPASLLWARCATRAEEADRRFKAVMESAPPDTKAECELELAHLLLMRERYPEAELAFAEWLEAHPDDERAEGAVYWKAVCLKEEGKEPEALAAADGEYRHGRQEGTRALAGLLVASVARTRGDMATANSVYRALVDAPWAGSVRPQALLGAAQSARTAADQRRLGDRLIKAFPDSEEADTIRATLKKPPRTKGKFGVQVGAYKITAAAKAEVAKWVRQGKAAKIVKRPSPAYGSMQCVILGPYATRGAAEAERDAIKAAGSEALVTGF